MLHVQHALVNKALQSSAKQQHEITTFTVYASVNSSSALPPPPGNCRAFACLVSPGGGALAHSERPGGRALANPGGTPEKFVDVIKGMFS